MTTAIRIRPLLDNVLISPARKEKRTTGGIIIPDTAQKRVHEGEVLAVGPGRVLASGVRVPVDVKVGDRVLFAPYTQGTKVRGQFPQVEDEESSFLIREDEILAVFGSPE